jgi:hypothetical protein
MLLNGSCWKMNKATFTLKAPTRLDSLMNLIFFFPFRFKYFPRTEIGLCRKGRKIKAKKWRRHHFFFIIILFHSSILWWIEAHFTEDYSQDKVTVRTFLPLYSILVFFIRYDTKQPFDIYQRYVACSVHVRSFIVVSDALTRHSTETLFPVDKEGQTLSHLFFCQYLKASKKLVRGSKIILK